MKVLPTATQLLLHIVTQKPEWFLETKALYFISAFESSNEEQAPNIFSWGPQIWSKSRNQKETQNGIFVRTPKELLKKDFLQMIVQEWRITIVAGIIIISH